MRIKAICPGNSLLTCRSAVSYLTSIHYDRSETPLITRRTMYTAQLDPLLPQPLLVNHFRSIKGCWKSTAHFDHSHWPVT